MDQQIDNKLLYQILFIVGIFMHRIENVHCVTTAEADRTLSNNIYRIIDHFQQDDPIGLPIEAIPDPFPVEDVSHVLAACLCRMTTTNTRAHGFSKFRVGFAHFDAKSLVSQAEIKLNDLLIEGNYTLSSILNKQEGSFAITLKNVTIAGNLTLDIDRNGHIRTKSVMMDIHIAPQDMHFDFENIEGFFRIVQSIMNNAPHLILDPMKPYMLREANKKIQAELNTNLANMADHIQFPNSILALDRAISVMRQNVQRMGYDPWRMKDSNYTMGYLFGQLRNTRIDGAASFYRTGDVKLSLMKQRLRLALELGMQQIAGATEWQVTAGVGVFTYSLLGTAKFSIECINVTLAISQSLDTRQRLQLEDLQFDIGNIQVRSDGAGLADYMAELLINVIPNLLRYQVMNALENPVKAKIQETLNLLDVGHLIKTKIKEYERTGSVNFGI